MLPFGRQSASNIANIIAVLDEGVGTSYLTPSTGTSGSTSTLPTFTDAPADQIGRAHV